MTGEELAMALAAARKSKTRNVQFPASEFNEASAYKIQTDAALAYDSKRIGYKIGATSAEARRIIGCEGPFFGPMFDADTVSPGSHLTVDETMLGLECEFAFQMARPFPGGTGDLTTGTLTTGALKDAVARCVPAIEIVGRRIAGDGFPTASQCIADFGLHAGFCAGPDMADWRQRDLSEISVEASIDGVAANKGTGGNVLGHPLAALLWLARALQKQQRRLEAGEWISTGTCLGVVAVKPATTVTATYSHGAQLSLSFV